MRFYIGCALSGLTVSISKFLETETTRATLSSGYSYFKNVVLNLPGNAFKYVSVADRILGRPP